MNETRTINLSLIACSAIALFCVKTHASNECLEHFRQQTSKLEMSGNEMAVVGVRSVASNGVYSIPAGLTSTGRFEIGSLTKPILHAIAHRLAKTGALDLNTSVSGVLAQVSSDAGAVTIRQLLAHRSGFPTNPTNLLPAIPFDPFADYDEDRIKEFLRYVRVEHKKEKSFLYSNVGYGLAGLMIEYATGQTLERHFGNYFQSLGMLNSTLGWRSQTKHVFDSESKRSNFGRGMVAAGGVVADPDDMGAYLSHLLSIEYHAFDRACESQEFCGGWFMEGTRRYRWHTGRTANFESFLGFGDGFGLFVLARSERRLGLVQIGQKLLSKLERGEVCGHG